MHLKDKGKRRGLLLQILVIFVISTSCYSEMNEPLSVAEVSKASIKLPVYYPDHSLDTDYGRIEAIYYYFDEGSELRLDTYFTIRNLEGKNVRVAKLSTFNLSGQLVDVNETKGKPPDPIVWAKKGGGGSCKILSEAYRNERITGNEFQSCLYWLDENLNQNKLYTIWPEEKAVKFINSLQSKKE